VLQVSGLFYRLGETTRREVVVPDQQTFCWVQDGLVVTREESVPAETPDSNCSGSALWRERRHP
jgi:hypothetical protein